MTKLQDALETIPSHLFNRGTLISVDPSCGSAKSMPGFALAQNGKVVESGRIDLHWQAKGKVLPMHRRLYELQTQLKLIVETPDILCIESLPPFMQGAGGGFRTAAVVNLHQAAGCVLATWNVQHVVPVAVISHQTLMKKLTNGTYVKTDENDALAILLCAMLSANCPPENLDEVIAKITRPV